MTLKKWTALLAGLGLALSLSACGAATSSAGHETPAASAGPKREAKVLVAYFSQPETTKPENMNREEANSTVVIDGKVLGNTEYMAQLIANDTGADLFRITPAVPYPTDHKVLVPQAKEEQARKARPAIAGNVNDMSQYDVIFLGYPNWWGDMPMILYTFLDTYDLSGKVIIPFNTHGGSGFSDTVSEIARQEPKATVYQKGLSISRDRIQDAAPEIRNWLRSIDLPGLSLQHKNS